jgi:hypothetical protein
VRRYLITVAIMAVLIGALFQGAEQTGVKLFNMAATIGILLFGIVGTIAINRHQSRTGLKEIETVLKSLEPDCLITDWAYKGAGRPDYLVVAPGGVMAICLDNTAQSSFAKRAAGLVARGRERAQASVRWLRERINEAGPGLKEPLSDLVREMPVEPVLLLVRRRATAEYSADGVTVLNAEQLAEHIRSLSDRHLLEEPARIKLTRVFRSA